jgi:hypothetical protein
MVTLMLVTSVGTAHGVISPGVPERLTVVGVPPLLLPRVAGLGDRVYTQVAL